MRGAMRGAMNRGEGVSRASSSDCSQRSDTDQTKRNDGAKMQGHSVEVTKKSESQILKPPEDPGSCPRLKERSIKREILHQGVKIVSGAIAMFSVYNLCYHFNQYYLKSFEDLSNCHIVKEQDGSASHDCGGHDPYEDSKIPENLAFLYGVPVMCGLAIFFIRKKIVKGVDSLFSLSRSQRNKMFNADLREHATKLAEFVRDNEHYVRQQEAADKKILSFKLDYRVENE